MCVVLSYSIYGNLLQQQQKKLIQQDYYKRWKQALESRRKLWGEIILFSFYRHPRVFFHGCQKEINIDVREDHQLVASIRAQLQTKPTTYMGQISP